MFRPFDPTEPRPQRSLGYDVRLRAHQESPSQETHDDAAEVILDRGGEIRFLGLIWAVRDGLVEATPIPTGA